MGSVSCCWVASWSRSRSRFFLYAALTGEHGKLRDEIATLRAEIRCFAEQEECDVARLLSELSRRG